MPAVRGHFLKLREEHMKNKKTGAVKLAPYCYITPITLILVVFVIGSVIVSIALGFTKYNILTPPDFRGLDNYTRLMRDARFLKALKNTLKLIVLIVPLQMLGGIIVSVFLVANRHKFLGKAAASVIFIPFLCSNAVVGVVWRELLNGKIPVVEKLFGLFKIEPSMLLGDAKAALIVVGLVAVWKWMGYYTVIYSSGLLGISDTYYEAARVDGAGKIRSFFMITLPLLKPTIILALFLSVTTSMRNFELIFNLTGGGPNNATTDLVMYAYTLCFKSNSAGYSMAVSNVLFLVVLVIALLQQRMMRREASEI